MSAFGVKRTCLYAARMSAFDPKRTFAAAFLTYPLTRVRNWTEVQLDFGAHNRDNQNNKFRAGGAVGTVLSRAALAKKDVMNSEPRLRDV
jgi:hypothetical protein